MIRFTYLAVVALLAAAIGTASASGGIRPSGPFGLGLLLVGGSALAHRRQRMAALS